MLQLQCRRNLCLLLHRTGTTSAGIDGARVLHIHIAGSQIAGRAVLLLRPCPAARPRLHVHLAGIEVAERAVLHQVTPVKLVEVGVL